MNTRSFTSKLFSIVMSVALIVGSCGFSPGTFAETKTDKPTNEVAQFNDFSVLEYQVPGMNSNVKFYYSDGFFTQSAFAENEHLYSTSIALAESATSTPTRILNLYSTLGFSGAVANSDYYATTSENTIGIASAYKKIKDGDNEFYVIPVAFRSGGYGKEWAGNGVIGDSSNLNHKNFQASADKAVALVSQVISDNKLPADKVKIWITGYSRGASVTNLAAKTLSDTYGKEDVYAYCFEPARCTTASQSICDQYTNIRNVIYDDDIVTCVPPTQFGFSWYGQQIILSNSTENMTEYAKQLQIVKPGFKPKDNFQEYTIKIDLSITGLISIASGETEINPEPTASGITQKQFIDNLFNDVTKNWGIIPTRDYYANTTVESGTTLEYAVKNLLDIIFNFDGDFDEQSDQLTEAIKNLDYSTYIVLYKMIKNGPSTVDWSDGFITTGRKSAYDDLWSALVDTGFLNAFDEDQKTALTNSRYTIMRLVLDFVYNDLKDGSATYLGTLIEFGSDMMLDHYPEKIMAFLRARDNYYVACTHSMNKTTGTAATTEKTGTYDTWTCSKCGQIYKDANGYYEITEDKKVIAKIDASTIKLSQDRYEETVAVENRKPTVTVKDTNGKELTAGTDYDVAYANYDKAGKATATITFKGNYSGTATKYYRIGSALYVSGTLKGYKGDGNVKLTIYKGNDIYATETYSASDSTYKLMTLHEGECYLKVEATGYVTRTYTLNVTDDMTQNVEIRQLGDVDLSGTISAADVTAMARHLALIQKFTDNYQLQLMDVTKDGKYEADDVTKLARYIAKIISTL